MNNLNGKKIFDEAKDHEKQLQIERMILFVNGVYEAQSWVLKNNN